MKIYKISSSKTGLTLFEGAFNTPRHAVEQAITDNVCLDHADLSGLNLTNAALDGARLRHARFGNTNLGGANLSEATFDSADFTGANLNAACLCYSSLRGCNFDGVTFGETDITSCDISGSLFSSRSAFYLNFADTSNMTDCYYSVSDKEACLMSRPPIVIHGLPFPVIFMDDHVMIGPLLRSWVDLASYTNDNLPTEWPDNSALLTFIQRHRDNLLPLIQGMHSKNLDINRGWLYK